MMIYRQFFILFFNDLHVEEYIHKFIKSIFILLSCMCKCIIVPIETQYGTGYVCTCMTSNVPVLDPLDGGSRNGFALAIQKLIATKFIKVKVTAKVIFL